MAFVKLDCGMLDSTTWLDKPARDMMLTALLMAVPLHIKEPTAQIEVKSLNETGWKVPPGDYGFVKAAGPAIAVRAQVAPKTAMGALERLGAPEKESRSNEFEGRRMVRINGGYLILNYDRYRQRDASAADRMRRMRERMEEEEALRLLRVTDRNVTQEEVEVEERSNKTKKTNTRAPRSASPAAPPDVSEEVWKSFSALRKARRAPITELVIENLRLEAEKAEKTLEEVLRICVFRGWQSFEAEWLTNGKGNGKPAEEPSRYARRGLAAKLEEVQAKIEAERANGKRPPAPPEPPPLTPEEDARRKQEIVRGLKAALKRQAPPA